MIFYNFTVFLETDSKILFRPQIEDLLSGYDKGFAHFDNTIIIISGISKNERASDFVEFNLLAGILTNLLKASCICIFRAIYFLDDKEVLNCSYDKNLISTKQTPFPMEKESGVKIYGWILTVCSTHELALYEDFFFKRNIFFTVNTNKGEVIIHFYTVESTTDLDRFYESLSYMVKSFSDDLGEYFIADREKSGLGHFAIKNGLISREEDLKF